MTKAPQSTQPGPQTTRGVQTSLGNPNKAIVKLSIPMIVAMFVHTLYNFVDGLWVAGLGPDALSAVSKLLFLLRRRWRRRDGGELILFHNSLVPPIGCLNPARPPGFGIVNPEVIVFDE